MILFDGSRMYKKRVVYINGYKQKYNPTELQTSDKFSQNSKCLIFDLCVAGHDVEQ